MKKKKPTVKILVGYHRPAVLLKDEVLTRPSRTGACHRSFERRLNVQRGLSVDA